MKTAVLRTAFMLSALTTILTETKDIIQPILQKLEFRDLASLENTPITYQIHSRPPPKSSSFADIRRRLNEDKASKKIVDGYPVVQESVKIQTNITGIPRHTPGEAEDAGINTEQIYNRDNDKVRLLHAYKNSEPEVSYVYPGTECTFERFCSWKYRHGSFVITNSLAYRGNDTGPRTDSSNKTAGHFLLLRLKPSTKELHVTSPLFSPIAETCRLQVWIYQEAMTNGKIRIIAETINNTQWLVTEIEGDDSKKWIKYDNAVGKISQDFNIIMEVVPIQKVVKGTLVAFDNIKLLECFPETDLVNSCTPFQHRCSQTNICINNTKVCDISYDCEYGDDETQNCDKLPYGARCNFEQDWCGWHNVPGKSLQWARHNGSTPTDRTGPDYDHTYMNNTGKYMYVNMAMGKEIGFASTATLRSTIFNPPPKAHGNASSLFYNSCTVRFYLHQYGSHKSGLMLQVTEIRPKENITAEIFWSYNNYGDNWVKKIAILPNITHKYFLHFDARRGIRYIGDVAIDDFSMSPECFGINIPQSELNEYNYWNPIDEHFMNITPHQDFINEFYYEITSCGARGRYGPVQENCTEAYNNTLVNVSVLHAPGLNGIQKWTVPTEGFYTFILVGASGGRGSGGMGSSRGGMVRTVLELRKGQELFFLVGQEGSSACIKTLGSANNSSCRPLLDEDAFKGVRGVLKMEVLDGGGGGGGATYVFAYNRNKQPIPLAIAAGGGGLGLGRFIDTGDQHGQAIKTSQRPVTGKMYGPSFRSAGPGGGWEPYQGKLTVALEQMTGLSLLQGGIGGQACYDSVDGHGEGGFGGGGGGCTAGGGGGGYSGGNAWSNNSTNGQGGFSYIDPNRTFGIWSEAVSGYHAGAGSVIIIPSIPGCGCNFRCLALDARRSQVTCICPSAWKLAADGKTCLPPAPKEDSYPDWMVVLLFFILIILLIGFGVMCFLLYNRYQHRTSGILRRKMLSGPDLQLNRLRVASDNMITEYNPNYEFGGEPCSTKDLKDIPRNQLQLQKALGQGAFGEVYQGFYRQRSGDAIEMPVAVKTLPAMSTQEAEMDFLLEALIMSKFNHPNIVHFIGVCFDKHPRFIVLELLAGGDLKNFLRESRPKPDKGSALVIRDLVNIAIDVAKGCKYMEELRFIHRDIAARNCLLTTKGPGRVVKIADFGMSRDIYRSDYYRKGGRAMLPIKWMPPEAFLDGIFTSKTDVWSFGVLLWEIMSMGYMPYTGCANRQVMQLVTSGGRLESPSNCPGPIYGIMTQCWHPNPEQRPNFVLILERLGYCLQDPDVINTSLPVFNRPPSQERDTTIMRPGNDDHCLEIPKAADYLIPNNTTSPSASSLDQLLPDNPNSWEGSYVIPHSKSTQPLLQDLQANDSNSHYVEQPIAINATTEKILPISSPPPKILPNQDGGTPKMEVNSLRAGISLDAAALAKQTIPSPTKHKKSYANVNTDDKAAATIITNGQAPYMSPTNTNYLSESINC